MRYSFYHFTSLHFFSRVTVMVYAPSLADARNEARSRVGGLLLLSHVESI